MITPQYLSILDSAGMILFMRRCSSARPCGVTVQSIEGWMVRMGRASRDLNTSCRIGHLPDRHLCRTALFANQACHNLSMSSLIILTAPRFWSDRRRAYRHLGR